MPKASIIIPIYNIAEHLHWSVESAMAQTEKDIEIILVDDGSVDKSAQKCDEYAAMDDRIAVLHQKNGGLSSARNAGIAKATAPYVLLLDGDDYLHKQALERLLAVASAYPSDIIQFHYEEVDAPKSLPNLKEMEILAQTHTAEEAFVKLYEMGGVCASGCTKLFRRSLLTEIPFEAIRHEDEMWCTRAFPKNLTITYIPDVLYGYVVRSGSIIHSGFSKSRLDIFKIKEERIVTLQALGLSDLEREEWSRLFLTIFFLYRDAKKAGDQDSRQTVLTYFKEKPILKYATVSGRMKLFFCLAKWNRKMSLDLYSLYWKLK